jgi:1,4-dihydroxy-2-naphthoate octaprenyltransferase
MILALAAAALAGSCLVARGGLPILVVGIASILSALATAAARGRRLATRRRRLFVFVFAGPAAVCGTYFVQAGSVSAATRPRPRSRRVC